MGYFRHHAIIVTSDAEDLDSLHSRAVEIFGESVSAVIDSLANGYRSFLVAPDGSKEGWDTSVEGDRRRARFIDLLTQRLREKPMEPVHWVHIQYGDDNYGTTIVSDDSEILRKAQE